MNAVRSLRRPSGQRGVTLIELLTVLMLIGVMMAMGSVYLRANYVRSQLSNTALSVKQALGSATWYTTKNQGPVYIWLDMVNKPKYAGRLHITGDALGANELYSMTIPNTLSLTVVPQTPTALQWPVFTGTAPTGWVAPIYYLECDTMNRTLDPTTGGVVSSPKMFSLTHLQMTTGSIKPRIDYQIQISPLFAVQSTAVKS